MPRSIDRLFAIAVLGIAFLAASPHAEAEIYRCIDPSGNTAYSQVPCPNQPSTVVNTGSVRQASEADCRWAGLFANEVARRMRRGQSSSAIFNAYGGLDAVSTGTVNIINYVYRFERNDEVTAERISALAGNMCQSGSLGDVSCEALPFADETEFNRCDEDDEAATEPAQAAAIGAAESDQLVPLPAGEPAPTALRPGNVDTAAQERCKKNIRDQIDAIDAEMRQGYDSARGEQYREQLRGLTQQLRAC